MFRRAATVFALLLSLMATRPVAAAELIMVEQQGCHYCITWKAKIGPIYPKTPEGAYAPLHKVDISDGAPVGTTFARKVIYTPTFILIDDGQEVGRIEGYPGEDFFWGLLDMMLRAKTDYQAPAETSSG